MPKDLLEKFDKEFDELIVFQTYEIPMIVKDDIKSLAHSHIEEAYRAGVENNRVLAEDFANWLHKHGYIDADYYAEEPEAVDEYMKQLEKRKKL